jgi:hypothetical protein
MNRLKIIRLIINLLNDNYVTEIALPVITFAKFNPPISYALLPTYTAIY